MAIESKKFISAESIMRGMAEVTDLEKAETPEIRRMLEDYHNFADATDLKRASLRISTSIPKAEREYMVAFSKVANRIHNFQVPRKELFEAKKAYWQHPDRVSTPEAQEEIAKIDGMSRFAGTACIMPVWSVRDDAIKFANFYSHDLHDRFLEGGTTPEEYNSCFIFTQGHEVLGHMVQGDFPINLEMQKRQQEGVFQLTDQEQNIVSDLRINSRQVRHLGRTFQRKLPGAVFGETFRQSVGLAPGVVEALHQVAHGHAEYSDELIAQYISKHTGSEFDPAKVGSLLQPIDVDKTISHLKTVGDLDSILKPNESRLKYSLGAMPTYQNFLENFEEKYIDHQNGGDANPDWQTLGESLLAVKRNIRFKPNAGTTIMFKGKGDPFSGEAQKIPSNGTGNGPFEWVEVESGKADAEHRQASREGRAAAAGIGGYGNAPPGSGTQHAERDLKAIQSTKLTDKIREEVRRFGNLFAHSIEWRKKSRPIMPPEQATLLQEERARVTAETGDDPMTPIPIGYQTRQIRKRPINGVILSTIDESASMSDTAVAAAKTALTEVCKSQKLAVIGVSMGQSLDDLAFSSFVGGKSNPKDFIKRYLTGGTGHFHRVLYDFEKQVLDHPVNGPRLKASLPEGVTMDHLRELWKAGKVGMLTVTDGGLPVDMPTAEEHSNWKRYADTHRQVMNTKRPPVAIISLASHLIAPLADTSLWKGFTLGLQSLLNAR